MLMVLHHFISATIKNKMFLLCFTKKPSEKYKSKFFGRNEVRSGIDDDESSDRIKRITLYICKKNDLSLGNI